MCPPPQQGGAVGLVLATEKSMSRGFLVETSSCLISAPAMVLETFYTRSQQAFSVMGSVINISGCVGLTNLCHNSSISLLWPKNSCG